MRFNRSASCMSGFFFLCDLVTLLLQVVAPRIELSATRVSGGFGRPALDYHVVLKSRTPRSRTETLLLPKQACFHLHLYPMLFVVFAAADSVGAYLPCQWAGRRSNPRLRFFRPPLDRLSYQPMLGLFLVSPVQCRHEKRPDVCVTSGLDERRFERSRRHMRKRYAGASLFNGVPPKRLPSHICSSRLDWNFDNMELSARL